jgi:hypothetical protein
VKKLLHTSKLSGAIRSVAKLASITFLSLALSYWIDYLGFITEGKLAAVLITPSLGVPNWSVIYIINTAPSPPDCPRSVYHFLVVFCFDLFLSGAVLSFRGIMASANNDKEKTPSEDDHHDIKLKK